MPSRTAFEPVKPIALAPRVILFLFLAILPTACLAELNVDPIFSDDMVLQRDRAIVVWGTAKPDAEVEISLGAKNTALISATASGVWKGQLKPLPASTKPATLSVKSGEELIQIKNVLLGDVWLCSGQSNMGFKLSKCVAGRAHVNAASDPLIRVNNYRDTWRPCVGEVAAETSGVAYYFARKYREMNPEVPIGLIVRALSGTPIEAWTPTTALNQIEFSSGMMKRFAANTEAGEQWKTYSDAVAERKRNQRKGNETRPTKRPKFAGDDETKVLAEIYYEDNPGRLWRERIKPLAGVGLAGVIWYQGERNSKAGETAASVYDEFLVKLVTSWRAAWGQGDFRFLAVQLPPFEKGGRNWKIVQERQTAAIKRLKNAALIDLSDLPDGGLHPPNKLPVGERLAMKAKPIAKP